jgi:hypothetical protein
VDDVDLSLPELWFYGTMVCVSILIFILVLLALAYGFVRVVLAAWEHLAPSAAEGSRPSPAPVKSHAPGQVAGRLLRTPSRGSPGQSS